MNKVLLHTFCFHSQHPFTMTTEEASKSKSTKRKLEEEDHVTRAVKKFASSIARQLQHQQPPNIHYAKVGEKLLEWADSFLEAEKKAHPNKTFRLCIVEEHEDGKELFLVPDASLDEFLLMDSLSGHFPSEMLNLPHFFGAVDIECGAILEWLCAMDSPPRCEQTTAKLARLEDAGVRRMMTHPFRVEKAESLSDLKLCVQIYSGE